MGFEIAIDVDYPDHRKTKALIARLGDPNADVYPLRLWLWAAKYARSGIIKGGARELEGVVRWHRAPLKLFRSMKAVGFVEVDSSGRLVIHGWKEGIGRALLAYDIKKFRLRKAYAEKHGLPFTDLPPDFGSLPEETGSILLSHSIPSQYIPSHSPSPNGAGILPEETKSRRGRRPRNSVDQVLKEAVKEGDARDREKTGP